MSTKPTFAEFFAGIGLIRMALEAQGWNPVFANDIDPKKRRMYQDEFGDADSVYHLGDIRKLPDGACPPVDLATASFPCTDISLAGSRVGLAGEQSSTLWAFVKALRNFGDDRPNLVLLENVPSFLTSNEGKDLVRTLQALVRLQYSVDILMVDAADFVPQSRRRLFVIGVLEQENHTPLEIQECYVRPPSVTNFVKMHPKIRWRLKRLPPISKSSRSLAEILQEKPCDSSDWWSDDRSSYLLSQMSERHREKVDEMMSMSSYTYGTVFRRMRNGRSTAELRTDGLVGCLRTPKGGSAKQILVRVGKGEFSARLLSPRECAHLMGAGKYKIQVSANDAYWGFGDGVCVNVIEWISENYLIPEISIIKRSIAKNQSPHSGGADTATT